MIPEGKQIGYQCENGHVSDTHATDHGAPKGEKCVCEECGALLTQTLIPIRACEDCGNTWAYAGDADRPTCPECKGKRTAPVGE